MKIIEHLQWRYATKKFDPTLKVSEEAIGQLKKVIQLAATSYGLQAFKVLIITDPAIKKQLQAASWKQSQVVDASHLIVFCNCKEVTDEQIDTFIQLKSGVQKIPLEALDGYGNFMKSKLGELTANEINEWTAKQTYIALGKLLVACAELKIDTCPMEGFEPEKYDEILGLTAQNLTASVVAAIGYRSEEDKAQFAPKVRKAMEELFVEL